MRNNRFKGDASPNTDDIPQALAPGKRFWLAVAGPNDGRLGEYTWIHRVLLVQSHRSGADFSIRVYRSLNDFAF